MSDKNQENNEYVDLPDDPEMAFATLQERKYADLMRLLESTENAGYLYELKYVDTLIAFDEVHDLGIFSNYKNPPIDNNKFYSYFHNFHRHAEISSQKFKMEAARKLKTMTRSIIVFDAQAREAIHVLISAIREKLNELKLPENKRDSLFNKLNEFAAEVDRNRTRTEAFFSFVVDTTRVLREVNKELKPLQQSMDRVLDLIENAKNWNDTLPPWKDRKRIEGPPKSLAPPQQDFDDEIPF